MKEFKESDNTAVFTTKYVAKEGSPILYVYHFEDGSWQFSGKEQCSDDKDFMVVSLGEIIKIDPTVNELGDLPIGFEAMRNAKDDNWKIIAAN